MRVPHAGVPAAVQTVLLLLLVVAGCDRTGARAARGDSIITVLQWGDEWVLSEFHWDLFSQVARVPSLDGTQRAR